MRDKKIIMFLLGQATAAMTLAFLLPISYALLHSHFDNAAFFAKLAIVSAMITSAFFYLGRGHRRRIEVVDSAVAMILVFPSMALLGAAPFVLMNQLSPINAFLETISDLTAAGVGFLPYISPFELKLWQATLMWQGSLFFVVVLVTLLPEVSGCFGMELSLSQGQIFSPMLGQMKNSARKIASVYSLLTVLSMFLFRLAGLDDWNALIMAMRCISTGGGEVIGAGNLYVEYAAAFSMLLACGNFLLYFRLTHIFLPNATEFKAEKSTKNFRRVIHEFAELLQRNFISNVKTFYSNSEVKFLSALILIGTLLVFFTVFSKNYITDGNVSFRMAVFHIISFVSTTGMTINDITAAPDFDRFFLLLLVTVGGCMGSVTGGLKVIRVLVLFKITAIGISKTIHPNMMTGIKVNGAVVPAKVIGRILSFFFLCAITLFVCAVILSLSGQPFSTSVVMTLACLTNVGIMPGLCDTSTFLKLPDVMKLFCALIFVVGRMEIFAFLIFASSIKFRREKTHWS